MRKKESDSKRAPSHDKDLVPRAVIIRGTKPMAATRGVRHEFQKLIRIRLWETGGTESEKYPPESKQDESRCRRSLVHRRDNTPPVETSRINCFPRRGGWKLHELRGTLLIYASRYPLGSYYLTIRFLTYANIPRKLTIIPSNYIILTLKPYKSN